MLKEFKAAIPLNIEKYVLPYSKIMNGDIKKSNNDYTETKFFI